MSPFCLIGKQREIVPRCDISVAYREKNVTTKMLQQIDVTFSFPIGDENVITTYFFPLMFHKVCCNIFPYR